MATLAEIRTLIRQRTDNEHTGDFVTNAELDKLINLKVKELYGLLVRFSLHRAETPYDITANGAADYAIPADFYAVLAVFRDDNGTPVYLTRHDHRLRPSVNFPGDANTYRIVGARIEFNPLPTSGTYTLVYVPLPATLVADADELDSVLGWEEYVVLACSIPVLVKEDGDPNTILSLKEDLRDIRARIVDEAKAAELSENVVVQDVRPRYRLPGSYNIVGYRGPLGRGWFW